MESFTISYANIQGKQIIASKLNIVQTPVLVIYYIISIYQYE